MLDTLKIASYMPYGKEKRGYGATKTSVNSADRCWCGVLRCALGNKNLCDVSFRSGKTEIVAHMAYESR
ncbi:Hok/Gef family protein [Salmonella enterica subsp. diarizonae serovar 18:I,v:z]